MMHLAPATDDGYSGDQLAAHLHRLERIARNLCAADTRADADHEDLVQDTFERVLRRPRAIRGADDAYLATALRNTHVSRLRAQRARVSTVVPAEDGVLESTPDPVERTDAALAAGEVLAAVHALPRPFRDAVLALDVAGYGAHEASRLTGIPAGTLMSRAFRGRARVAELVAA